MEGKQLQEERKLLGRIAGSMVLRIRDVYPGSRIPNPGSRNPDLGAKNSNKRERGEKIFCHTTNFTNLKIILFLIWCKKKFGPVFKEL